MSFLPSRYVIVSSTARKIETPEPITDPEIRMAIFQQHCADLMGETSKPIERDVFWQPVERRPA